MCPFCQPYRVKKTSSKQSKRHDLHLKWVKEAIHIRLHPNNINRDSGIEIPEAWMPMIKNTQQENGTTADHGENSYSLEQWNNRRIEMHQSQPTFVI